MEGGGGDRQRWERKRACVVILRSKTSYHHMSWVHLLRFYLNIGKRKGRGWVCEWGYKQIASLLTTKKGTTCGRE